MTSFTFTDPLSANTQQQQQWPQNTGTTSVMFNDPISANTQSLFPQTTGNPYQQHANNPYQQFGGFGQNLQAQMTGMPQQSQLTGLAPFQTSTITGFQQPQPTGSNNPFAQFNNNNNQQQQRQQQQQTLQPQATGAFATSQFGSQQQQQTLQPQPTSAFGTSTFGQTLSASPTFTPTTALSRSPTLGVFNPTSSATAGQSRAFTFPSSAQVRITGVFQRQMVRTLKIYHRLFRELLMPTITRQLVIAHLQNWTLFSRIEKTEWTLLETLEICVCPLILLKTHEDFSRHPPFLPPFLHRSPLVPPLL